MQPELRRLDARRTVLLVGLDEPFGTTVEHELSARGLAVERAAGGRDALARWSDPPDVVVFGLDGGDIDPLEFAQAVASADGPPLIACTRARAAAAAGEDTLAALGITAVIARPCHIDAVAEAVHSALGAGGIVRRIRTARSA
jgi:DNA-binding response OmpR family regulator